MFVEVFTLCFLAVAAFGCDVPTQHYKTIGCTPVGTTKTGCPERFDCPAITNHDKSKCYFNGRTYNIGDMVPAEQTSEFCSALCYCREAEPYARFRCAHVDCPEFFGRFDYENCIRQYKVKGCCSTNKVCGDARKQLATCELDREIFLEGQRMYPSSNKCRTCICSAGFDLNATDADPNCYDNVCGFELYETKHVYSGAAPVFKTTHCCPWEWRMPKDADAVVKGFSTNTDPKLQCKYGKLTLNVGDTLVVDENQQGQKVSCKCAIPPLVQCDLL